MRVALTIAANDMRRRLRDRTFFIQGIGTPLMMALIIGMSFGGGFSFNATIGVADADGSEVSRGLVAALTDQPADGSPITFKAIATSDVEGAVSRGEVDSAIVLPEGFGTSVTGDQPQPIAVVVDAGKRTTADVTESIASRLAAGVNAVRLSVNAAVASGPQPPDAAQLQRVIAEGQLVQVVLGVRTVAIGGLYSPIAYFAPSMAMLFLFFTIGSGARSLVTERKEGTLQRVRAAPVSDVQILLGKTVGVLVLGFASLVVVWLATAFGFRASWGDPAAVLAIIASVVVATAGISLLVTGVARTDVQAEGFTSIVAFMLALLGGNFMSPGSMPPLLETLGKLTPNGWALRALTDIGAGGAGVSDVLPAVGVILGIGVVAGVAGLSVLRRKVAA